MCRGRLRSTRQRRNDLVNNQHEINLARRWLQAASAGDFTSAWAASDLLRNQGIDYSSRERWFRPLWDGSPIDSRNVLIRCWRGLGDAIHFIRYAPLVRAKASSLTVEVPRALIPLFRTVHGIDRLIELDQSDPQVTNYVEIESTELPYVFRTTLDTIPRTIPYFDIPGYASEPGTQQLNVGLCWCGGSYDLRRAMRLSDLEPLSELREANFFQVQRGKALRQIVGASIAFGNPSDRSMDLRRTASLIKSLDLIVSVDTMVAHLAGALGKRVYLLLHADADWRWLKERDDSPWYPTMKLFRQSDAGDWKSVVNELMGSIRDLAGTFGE
jgi:Glycosyltransferase family 9 (heptosyltransferase)